MVPVGHRWPGPHRAAALQTHVDSAAQRDGIVDTAATGATRDAPHWLDPTPPATTYGRSTLKPWGDGGREGARHEAVNPLHGSGLRRLSAASLRIGVRGMCESVERMA